MRRDPSVPLKPGKKHPLKIRIKAYKYWTKCHKVSQVHKQLSEDGIHVTIATIIRWKDNEDWEAREAVENNELRRILRTSDDPVLRQLVMDDLEYVKVLRALRGVLQNVLKRKNALKPRNMAEALTLIRFLRTEREGLLGAAKAKEEASPMPRSLTINNFNDQRRLDFAEKLRSLPPDQLAFVMDQIQQGMDQAHPVLEEARTQIIDVKSK